MKLLHSITITVIDKENNFEKIESGFDYLIPFDLVKNNIKLKSEYIGPDPEIEESKPITIYTLDIEKQSLMTQFIEYLRKMLSPIAKKEIMQNAQKFMEEDCIAYLRIDKDEIFNKKITLTKDGNCFHVKLKIAAYPKKKESAIKILEQLFFQE